MDLLEKAFLGKLLGIVFCLFREGFLSLSGRFYVSLGLRFLSFFLFLKIYSSQASLVAMFYFNVFSFIGI